ncbi:hypothetical protein ANN_24177 [Periplaneta americana]|uniref:Uncharacterized protein n=1 Tax=Periplaneta americana TaxID=6978 RepID=A0ABQ8S2R0_PERAM|nr:hypothetical protein ANN_24177 [Periplaneta americana]
MGKGSTFHSNDDDDDDDDDEREEEDDDNGGFHDKIPAHFSLAARQQQTATFGDRWIGYQGPVPWPARSPDLNPLDFFLWRHMKTLVYTTPVDQVDDFLLRQLSKTGLNLISDTNKALLMRQLGQEIMG